MKEEKSTDMQKKHMVIPIFVPHKGCPFDCIYCNQKIISGFAEEMTVEKMTEIIESYLTTAAQGKSVEIGFYGGSFTGIERQQQIAFLQKAHGYIQDGRVKGIRLSTRPDYINEEILCYLKKFGVSTIELGVQSMDDEILSKSCRGHTADVAAKASGLINSYGFELGIQTMVGLPGDTCEKSVRTANLVVALRPKIVRIYPALVIKGTMLEELYCRGEYKPLSLDISVEICTKLLEIYDIYGINVIRIGLQPTEQINTGAEIIAGPFHPAFRQLVESRLMLKKMEGMLEGWNNKDRKDIIIYTNPSELSVVTGQKRCNILHLKEKYGFERITVRSYECQEKEVIILPAPWQL